MVYAQNLQRNHIDLYHSISEETFNSELQRINSNLPELTTNQLLVELMMLTHKIGDGHTSLPLWSLNLNSFPVKLKRFGRELYVIGTTSEHKGLLGKKLVAISNTPAETLINQFALLAPFSENPYSTAVRAARYMSFAELLNGTGAIDSVSGARFIFASGEDEVSVQLEASESPDFTETLSYRNEANFRIGSWPGRLGLSPSQACAIAPDLVLTS